MIAALASSAAIAHCHKTFTRPMASRAIHVAYEGDRQITHRDRLNLTRYIRCQRHSHDRAGLHRLWAHEIAVRARARKAAWTSAVASWYYDAGTTACGFHATYGFASLFLPCGAKISMSGPNNRTIIATMQDHGPYVAGRTFDLNPALKAALGCSDICTVKWHR